MALFGIENVDNLLTDVRDKFDISRFMEFSDGWYDSLNSGFIDKLLKLSPAGYYTIETPDGRPDLVSYKIYGDTQYWWILLIYNDIICPDDLKSGMQIRYPNVNQLHYIYNTLPVG